MRLLSLSYSRAAGLFVVMFLLILGVMPLLSQSSEPRLNNSDETLMTWEGLSETFQRELFGLRMNLLTALNEAEASRTSSEKLTSLYESSLKRIDSLETYNRQIGERMQERDEDLAWAYDELDAKDLAIAKKNTLIWKLITIIIAMGAVIVSFVVFKIIKAKSKISLGVF